MSLYQLDRTGKGLKASKGPEFAGNIRRVVFELAAGELHRLGFVTLTGDLHRITEQGRQFAKQRFEIVPLDNETFSVDRRPGSRPLPAMERSLVDEIARDRREMNVLGYAAGGISLALVLLLGLTIYAQTH